MIFTAFLLFWAVVLYNLYFYVAYRRRDLKGKAALITGGGSGIGRAMAILLAKRGVRVVLWDLNRDGMDRVRAEIEAFGGVCATYTVDVSNRELVYATARDMGHVDIVINNAGIVTGKSLLDCPDELMVKTVMVNTVSHFWTIKAFLPAMLKNNEGTIVTIASAAGTCGVAGLVDYCASKFGAVGTAEALYMELRKQKSKVKSLLVCPYYINTGMFDGVKTKYPFLLPILEEKYVAERIVTGIERGEESISMPYIVGVALAARCLPASWQAFVAEKLGLSDGMDAFKGRGGPAAVASGKKSM